MAPTDSSARSGVNPQESPFLHSTAAGDEATPHGLDLDTLPPLMWDGSFWGMTFTQFFGAFNDNLFKQLMLLLAVPIGALSGTVDKQGLATIVFSLPFVLFSGYAGYLSDRYSKRTIIVISKVAEIVAMALGIVAFLSYRVSGYQGLLVVLFLMGAQSAFFGPGKYGILPEMLRRENLPGANGIIVMTTFLAIILGTAMAGLLREWLRNTGDLWIGSTACVAIAVLGTCTSVLVRRVPAAKPELGFRISALTVPPETRHLLRTDSPLLAALLASCVFWLVSGIVMQAVNSLGLVQLGVGDFWTSTLVATIGLGIALGAVLAGLLSHGRADFRLVRCGTWGIILFLVLLSISRPGGVHWLGYFGSIVALTLLGASAGFFAIPVQVFIQARPPEGLKGRMIAVMNQTNFIAILLSGVVYTLFDRIVVSQEWPRSAIFAMMACLMLPVLLFYRPRNDRP